MAARNREREIWTIDLASFQIVHGISPRCMPQTIAAARQIYVAVQDKSSRGNPERAIRYSDGGVPIRYRPGTGGLRDQGQAVQEILTVHCSGQFGFHRGTRFGEIHLT